jgi:hypothetical protein
MTYPHYLAKCRFVGSVVIDQVTARATADHSTGRDDKDRMLVIERTDEHTVTLYRENQGPDGHPNGQVVPIQALPWSSVLSSVLLDQRPVALSSFAGLPKTPTKAEKVKAAQETAIKEEEDRQAAAEAAARAEQSAVKRAVEEANIVRAKAEAAAIEAAEAREATLKAQAANKPARR